MMRNGKLVFLLLILFGCGSQVRRLDSIAESIDNSYQSAQKIEQYQMKRYSTKVSRKDSTPILKLDNNQELVLTDHDEEDDSLQLYSFREYYDSIKVFVVEIQLYEGVSYLLVNSKTGETLNIFGKTKLSPDMKRLVSYNTDLEAGYSANGIQIIDLKENHFKTEYEFEPEDWGPENVNWVNQSEIEIEKFGFKDGNIQYIGKSYLIKKGQWEEKIDSLNQIINN